MDIDNNPQQSNKTDPLGVEQNNKDSMIKIIEEIKNQDLKAEIIEPLINEKVVKQGYEVQDFHNYLDAIKIDNTETVWTLDKLENAIRKFKEVNSPCLNDPKSLLKNTEHVDDAVSDNSEGNSFSSQNPEENKTSSQYLNIPKTNFIKKSLTQIPKLTDANGEILTEMLHVKKLKDTSLTDQVDAFVRIEKASPVKGGMFSKDYIEYQIKTYPIGWFVKRNYSDFFALRTILQKLYPRLIIPSIPKVQSKEKFGEDCVRQRIYVFERFLNNCLMDENLRSEPFLNDFLSVTDNRRFNSIKSDADRIPKQNKVQEMRSKEGVLPLDLRTDLSEYCKIAENYSNQTEPVMKEIRNLSKRLALEIKQVSTTIVELGDRFGLLQGFSSYYNQKICKDEISLDSIYLSLQKAFHNWGEKLAGHMNLIKKSLTCFYKYNCYESESYREMNQKRMRLEEEYNEQKQSLKEKKEKLFKLGDTNKWDLDPIKSRNIPRAQLLSNQELASSVMLYEETEELRRKRDMYGVINFSVCSEMVKILKKRCFAYQENFQCFASKQISFCKEMQQSWSEFGTDMSNIRVDTEKIW